MTPIDEKKNLIINELTEAQYTRLKQNTNDDGSAVDPNLPSLSANQLYLTTDGGQGSGSGGGGNTNMTFMTQKEYDELSSYDDGMYYATPGVEGHSGGGGVDPASDIEFYGDNVFRGSDVFNYVRAQNDYAGAQNIDESTVMFNMDGHTYNVRFGTLVDMLRQRIGGGSGLPLLTPMYFDHVVDSPSWLLASLSNQWYSADDYPEIYGHLTADAAAGATNRLSVSWLSGDAQFNSVQQTTIVTCKIAPDGHRIVETSNDSALNSLYLSAGAAYFYRLDIDHRKFSLPRNRHFFSGVGGNYTAIENALSNVGGYAYPFVPRHQHSLSVINDQGLQHNDDKTWPVQASGRYDFIDRTLNGNTRSIITNAAYVNCNPQSNGGVRPPTVRMLLYYSTGR